MEMADYSIQYFSSHYSKADLFKMFLVPAPIVPFAKLDWVCL